MLAIISVRRAVLTPKENLSYRGGREFQVLLAIEIVRVDVANVLLD